MPTLPSWVKRSWNRLAAWLLTLLPVVFGIWCLVLGMKLATQASASVLLIIGAILVALPFIARNWDEFKFSTPNVSVHATRTDRLLDAVDEVRDDVRKKLEEHKEEMTAAVPAETLSAELKEDLREVLASLESLSTAAESQFPDPPPRKKRRRSTTPRYARSFNSFWSVDAAGKFRIRLDSMDGGLIFAPKCVVERPDHYTAVWPGRGGALDLLTTPPSQGVVVTYPDEFHGAAANLDPGMYQWIWTADNEAGERVEISRGAYLVEPR